MSGWPGSGKSAQAADLAEKLRQVGMPAAVIDKDKLLERLTRTLAVIADSDEQFKAQANDLAYEEVFEEAERELLQRKTVIIDSPCYRNSVAERGFELAHQFGVPYFMLELTLPTSLRQTRLNERGYRRYVANPNDEPPSVCPPGVVPLVLNSSNTLTSDLSRLALQHVGLSRDIAGRDQF